MWGTVRSRWSGFRQANTEDTATLVRGEVGIRQAAEYVRRGKIGSARNQLMRVADNMNRLQRRTPFRGVRLNAQNVERRSARGLQRLESMR